MLAEKETEDKMATSKEEMYAKFQPWVLATYGDSAKTKTITVRKAARIRALLSTNEKVISVNKIIFENMYFHQKVVRDSPESIGKGPMSSGMIYLYGVRPG